jgi:CRP-like cAMP-binding protein
VPKFERFFRHLLQNAFVALQERILSGMSETAEERYLNFRKKYPAMDARIPQNQIASFLGITPESLSRVRRQLMKPPKA